jgi:hypothetical protein
VIVPIVETGMFAPSDVIWPDGRVRLFAVRTPVTWATEMPLSVSFAGSSVTTTSSSRPPVRSTVATPSIPCRAGTTCVRATCAAASRPSWVVPATDAMMTGEALMLRAATCGETVCGRPAVCRFCSIVARASLTSVPNSNWATTIAMELAELDESAVSRGTLEMVRSIGFVTWLATSAAPTPGYGAITVMTGKSMSGSSSCLRLPQAEMPATKSPNASRRVTLRLATDSSVRRLTQVLLRW